MKKILELTLVTSIGLTLLISLQGCTSLSYYQQLLSGHLALVSDRKPIPEIISNPNTTTKEKQKLELILEARKFAKSELNLDVGKHYSRYVDINRDYVVWNVFASPELSLDSKTWCYPLVGCLGYRGYYNKNDAIEEAAQLKQRGYDIYVGGATAYSTLGWFEDPVLSNFLKYSDTRLVGLIFHELSHQKLYIKGDTKFNESFATAVEIEGLKLWFKDHNTEDFNAYLKQKNSRKAFVQLVIDARENLQSLYESDLTDSLKREEKQNMLSALRQSYQKSVETGLLPNHYQHWFKSVNNAKINTVAFYHQWVPAFRQAFIDHNRDWNQFFQWASDIGKQPKDSRVKVLNELNLKAKQFQTQ